MVEHVVCVEAELRLDALGDGEVLRQRHVVIEGMRATKGIESSIPNLTASGKREWTGGWAREGARVNSSIGRREQVAIGKCRNWIEPIGSTLPGSCSTARGHVMRSEEHTSELQSRFG